MLCKSIAAWPDCSVSEWPSTTLGCISLHPPLRIFQHTAMDVRYILKLFISFHTGSHWLPAFIGLSGLYHRYLSR